MVISSVKSWTLFFNFFFFFVSGLKSRSRVPKAGRGL